MEVLAQVMQARSISLGYLWFLLNVQAIITAKINYQNTAHSTVTFGILFETSHFNSLLQVTLQLNSQAFSKKFMSNLVKIC